jgi:hypothetical protein
VWLPTIEPQAPGEEVSQDRKDLFAHREQGAVIRRFFIRPVHPEPDHHGVDAGREVRGLHLGQWRSRRRPDGSQLAYVQTLDQELHGGGSSVIPTGGRDSRPSAKCLAELAVGPPFRLEAFTGRRL